jgi:hypothetical protein
VPSISTESFGSDSVNVNGRDAATATTCSTRQQQRRRSANAPAGAHAARSGQEFQVLTSQYDAEFGRTSGAVINAVTKQGATLSRLGLLFPAGRPYTEGLS